ncbi:glycosyltransferase [Patescibacteria group bacterium]|nr:glycosyltransferase [Patescibacteria group bacterium]
MQNKPLVSIIILTHNRKKACKMCLDSVYSQDYHHKEIIVADNGSFDSTVNFLKFQAKKRKIKLILNRKNKGACIGRNQGFLESKGEYILFLDSDVVLVDKSIISNAVGEISQHEKLGELGGIGFLDEKLSRTQHGLLKFDKGLEINLTYLNQIPRKINFDVDYIQSDFALLRREVFEKVGGFDPFYFYYPEDVDLSFRIKKIGFQVAITPKVKFWHQYFPRRTEINHSRFHKKVYLFFKNFSIFKGLDFYLNFLRNGVKRIKNTSNKIKFCFLILQYFTSFFFWIWLFLFLPVIKMRNRINFLSENQSLFSQFSEKILRLPILLENKIIAFMGSVLFWIKRKRGKRGLYLFITNQCNYSCVHCFLGDSPKIKKKELTIPEIEKTYHSLRKNIGGVSITGGEPFLRRDIVEICKIFQEPPFVSSIGMNTNGFAPELIKNKVNKILTNKPKGQKLVITVSLDGLEETHDKIRRQKGAFKNAVKTILLLKELKQDSPNFRVRAQITLMEMNYKDFYDLFNFVSIDLGVDFSFNWFRDGRVYGVDQHLIFEPMSIENDRLVKLPSMEKCEEICEFLLENQWQNLNMNLLNKYTLEILRDKKFLFPCVAPELNLVIYANGDISFCELVKPIHNIREFNYDVKKILKSEKWEKISAAVKKCFCIHPCILSVNLKRKHLIDIKLENIREFKKNEKK